MSAAAIKAGKAWVEMAIRDKTAKGLNDVQQRFFKFGQRLAGVGLIITGAATSITAGLVAAATRFAAYGSQIDDFAQQAGVSAEEISALGYAAQQSGSSLEDVAAAMRGSARFTAALAQGSKAAQSALAQLGITSEQWMASSPTDRIKLVADGLADIEDPGLRAAMAMQVLGRSGSSLVPLLAKGSAEIGRLTNEAHDLGQVWSGADAESAGALGDAWGRTLSVFDSVVKVVGAALAPALTDVLDMVTAGAAMVVQFIDANRDLVRWFTVGAIVAMGIGVALTTLGVTFSVIAVAAGGFMAAISAVVAVVGFLLTPLGWLTAAVVAAGVAFARYGINLLAFTEEGRAAFAAWSKVALQFWGTIKQTAQGVFDAIMAGNWSLAGEVAMAGLNTVFAQGIMIAQGLWDAFKVWLTTYFAGLAQIVAKQVSAMVDSANASLAGLGLELPGSQTIKNTAKGLAAGAAALPAAAAKSRDDNLKKSLAAVTKAQMELTRATERATKARADLAESRVETVKRQLPTPAQMREIAGNGSSTFGAFNAAVKGMLGQTASEAEVQRQIADNTAGTRDAVEALTAKIEEFGVFVE
jgi:hypothetical protein